VKLLRLDEGTRHLVGWMAAGGVIGLEGVFGERYRHSAVAIEPLEYCRIPRAVIRYLEGAGHGFCRELGRLWQANMDECDSFIVTLGAGTAKKRLARLLLKLGAMHEGRYCVSLRRSDIGAALGVSMETASRLMAEFRRRGLLRVAGRRMVCDRTGLGALAGLTRADLPPA
jgi:CRP-like cAMP-binding protein